MFMCQTQARASDLSIYNIFVPQKVNLLKISDDVIACDLWCAPPPSIKNPCNAYEQHSKILELLQYFACNY